MVPWLGVSVSTLPVSSVDTETEKLCLSKGSSCGVCTFLSTGCGCQNFPGSAACAAPGALPVGPAVPPH